MYFFSTLEVTFLYFYYGLFLVVGGVLWVQTPVLPSLFLSSTLDQASALYSS